MRVDGRTQLKSNLTVTPLEVEPVAPAWIKRGPLGPRMEPTIEPPIESRRGVRTHVRRLIMTLVPVGGAPVSSGRESQEQDRQSSQTYRKSARRHDPEPMLILGYEPPRVTQSRAPPAP